MEQLVSTTSQEQNDYFNEANATFGDRLAAARQAKGLDVDGLSEKLGVDVRTVKIWERDADMPHANRIQMLAGLLNVSMVWLVSGEGNGTSEVADTFERPSGINDALGEISQLKAILLGAVEKIEKLEERLQDVQ
jgi:transcriptional regulator with XRE-family HTH domain